MDLVDATRRSGRAVLGFDAGIWSEVTRRDHQGGHGVIIVLGAHGALIKLLESNDQFAVGRPLTLRFQLPGSAEAIRCGCVVRSHVAKYDIGVEFTLMRAAHRIQLVEIIDSRLLVAAA